jgi:hypothetical protein|tara:strand:- start:663 stop:932 length:270 start_codon:yes stop_codon:yes gene_type:complete
MKEEKQFLVDLQHESNKIPETNKNFDGEYIARIYGGSCVPYTLVEKDGRVSKGIIEKLEVNGKVIFKILYSNGVNSGRKFNSCGFEIGK